ncbi:MAG: hypothetical protein ACLFV4_08805 [Candidatus Hydrogenedentota bacterium]
MSNETPPSEAFQQWAEKLADTNATWTERRDAAEALGHLALTVLKTLHNHTNDEDAEVCNAVERALEQAAVYAHGDITRSESAEYTLDELVQPVEEPSQYSAIRKGDRYVVNCALPNNRRQVVHVEPHTRKDGTELIRIYTICGPAQPDAYRWALRANRNLPLGALAVAKYEGAEHFILLNCYLANTVTPANVLASVRELSRYGDWIEQKITGLDDF